MASKKKDEIISEASFHTIKKFDLIESYVKSWAPKLLNNKYCDNLVFIDCMCNSGEYIDKDNKTIYGTPVRVAHSLLGYSKQYPNKKISIYFNDYSNEKISHLKTLVPQNNSNFHIYFSAKDGNALLKEIAPTIIQNKSTNYLLIYDPYDAAIDWGAILPYINNWGEVIINHMLSDSARAVKVAKSDKAVKKYESTYLTDIDNLLPYGSDKTAYEERIEKIITQLHKGSNYYIASFPFFNTRNSIVYNLIHCTNNKIGFRLYKHVAWKVFGGKSSTLNTYGKEQQLVIDFDNGFKIKTTTFDGCYYIKDIAEYLQKKFNGKKDVPITEVWELLDDHPVFPAEGFKKEIKQSLKDNHNAIITKDTISFESEV